MINLDRELEHEFKGMLAKNSYVAEHGVPHSVFNLYKSNKEHLYEKFGEQFSVRKKIYIDRSKDSAYKSQVLSEFLKKVESYGAEYLGGFFREMSHVTGEEFAANKFRGMKLTRFMKDLLHNSYLATQVENEYSRQLMKLKPTQGYLVLSIHPTDYITMSESGYNWDSCQSISGDYAAGTVALMSDDCTLVAYITTENKKNMDCGYWWPKKWRCLVHVSRDHNTFVFNRQYPYHSADLDEQLALFIKEVWSDKDFSYFAEHPDREFIYKNDDSVHYDDLDTHSARVLSTISDFEDVMILTGEAVPCFCCQSVAIIEADKFLCDSCEYRYVECEDCGLTIHEDDSVYLDDTLGGYTLCENCAELREQEQEEAEKEEVTA
jgi:hypothetical protein